ncbi:MAG: hypothetical protein MI757_10650 [Pirellulales bacterium]|nr:hypothetical protein [Pirellulales bacterium]
MDGVSLMPLLSGEELSRDKPLYWQWGRGKAIRDGKWKAVTHGKGWNLYDIASDRTEMNDLMQKHPDRLKRMIADWETWYASTAVAKQQKPAKKKQR